MVKRFHMAWIYRELRDWWRTFTEDLPLFPALAVVIATCLVILCEVYGGSGFYRREIGWGFREANPYLKLTPHIYWYSSSFFFYALIPIVTILAARRKLSNFGITLGDWRLGLKILAVFTAVMIGVVAISLQTKSFSSHYPLNKSALLGIGPFLVYESFSVAYFFAWEFIWRGYVLFALYPSIKNWAILVQMVPFALLHIGKPVPEVFASVFAGLILGALALRTRSMIYCWLLHAVSAFVMDLGVFIIRGKWIF